MEVKLFIPGMPVAKQRPKFFRRGALTGTYTPKKTVAWENLVALISFPKRPPGGKMGLPIRAKLIFTLPRPKTLPKRVIYHVKRPDLDNLEKSIWDGMNKIMFTNDSQIYQVEKMKVYGDKIGVAVELTYVD